ncbi:hypothetical protein SAMN04488103_11920 [Gemmobacter aquatilis]|uniref:Uncharacterized protein n=1 Tax=Gemmobacter aquatilis TaxID=933059 RepID=A0A1H8NGV2_9RHOB|nr:hypothetical protein SAMN04488103_11920 [Gemmobacter aquatilis]
MSGPLREIPLVGGSRHPRDMERQRKAYRRSRSGLIRRLRFTYAFDYPNGLVHLPQSAHVRFAPARPFGRSHVVPTDSMGPTSCAANTTFFVVDCLQMQSALRVYSDLGHGRRHSDWKCPLSLHPPPLRARKHRLVARIERAAFCGDQVHRPDCVQDCPTSLRKRVAEKLTNLFILAPFIAADEPGSGERVSPHVELCSCIDSQHQQGLDQRLAGGLMKAANQDLAGNLLDQDTRSGQYPTNFLLKLHPDRVKWQRCFEKKRTEILDQLNAGLNRGDQVERCGLDDEWSGTIGEIPDHFDPKKALPLSFASQ